MVTHVLRIAQTDCVAARPAHYPAPTSPPHPPRGASRNVLLHHDRLAQLPVRSARLLDVPRASDRAADRLQTSIRRPRLGEEDQLKTVVTSPVMNPAANFYQNIILYVSFNVHVWVLHVYAVSSFVYYNSSFYSFKKIMSFGRHQMLLCFEKYFVTLLYPSRPVGNFLSITRCLLPSATQV